MNTVFLVFDNLIYPEFYIEQNIKSVFNWVIYAFNHLYPADFSNSFTPTKEIHIFFVFLRAFDAFFL